MKKIGVFLSSKANLPDSFTRAAEEVGAWIGRTERTLVYGGSARGLMEVLAQSVRRSGGRVMGVVPEIVEQRGLMSEAIDIAFHCVDLNDRKAVMVRESDLLLALPGGIGTLDEVFTVLASNSIGLTRCPVVLYNVDDCWTPLLETLERLHIAGLVDTPPRQLLKVVNDVDELARLCDN